MHFKSKLLMSWKSNKTLILIFHLLRGEKKEKKTKKKKKKKR